MKIDRTQFLALALGLSVSASACTSNKVPDPQPDPMTQGQQTLQGDPTPGPAVEGGDDPYAGMVEECIEWDPSGECINFEYIEDPNSYVAPAEECIEWDPSGECINWEPSHDY